MARSCGIHIGQRRWAVVVLEGNAKKHRILLQEEGDVPEGDDPIQATAKELREVAKRVKAPGENIGLAVDSSVAAYRTLSLPFDDPAKIEDVIKFEVESELPQWDIDDVIVDFQKLSGTPGVESNLLVTAVPKERLEARIRACEKAGLEPYEAELDTIALFNAAHARGLLDPEGAQVLIHVGEASTAVVIADGGHLAGMRSIHTGAAPAARAAAPEAEVEGAEPEVAPPPVDPEEAARLRASAAARIRRELARTVGGAATDKPIQSILVTGMELPELFSGPVLDVPIQRFAEAAEPVEGEDVGRCAVAYGVALRRLGGGVLKGSLRREELRYTGKFERLELPLAVFGMLLLTCLWVQLIVLDRQVGWRGEGDLAKGDPGDLQIWLEASNAFMLPDPEEDYAGRLKTPPEAIETYARAAQAGAVEDRTKMEQLREIERLLTIEILNLKKELGIGSDTRGGTKPEEAQPQSALEALTAVLDLIEDNREQVGLIGLRSVQADTQRASATNEGYVVVKLDVDFFADNSLDATRHYNDLQSAFESAPWCKEFEPRKSVPIDGDRGITVDGMTLTVDTNLIPDAAPAGAEG